MDPDEFRLRTLLINIGNKLSRSDRQHLGLLLGDVVPRRDIDTITRDNRASMDIIWDALINRQKITPDNINYLIELFEGIQRLDIVQQLKQYSTASNNSSDLFARIDP
jgi:hypothetical protein